jgi:4-oxalocrotonate tautomerase
LVQIKLVESVFRPEQKRKMIHKLTDAVVSTEGENRRKVTFVTTEKIKSGDWGSAGKR